MAIKLSTGKEAFPIEFDNGDKVEIFFNPNDPDLAIRMRDFQGRAEERLKEIEDVDLDANGLPSDIAKIDEYEKLRNIVYEEMDRAFNSKISEHIFKHCSPFAIVDGNYFWLQFIEAIKPEIEKRIAKSNEQAQRRMSKYLNKYGR